MKKVVLYITIVVIALYAVNEFVYNGLRKNKCGIFNKYNTIFFKGQSFETLIIGSSRAESNFNCKIIDSVLNTNSFNMGIQGATLPFVYDMFKAYLINHSFPRNLIVNIDYHVNRCDNDTIYNYARFFPYLTNNVLYEALYKRDRRFFKFKHFAFYSLPFMGDKYLTASLRGYLKAPGAYDKSYYKGYAPVLPLNYVAYKNWKYETHKACDDAKTYSIIDSLAILCKNNNSKMILVLSPMYYKVIENITNRKELIEVIHQKAGVNECAFYNYTAMDLSKDSSLFADPYHTNEKGGLLFSEKFTADVKAVWRK